MNHTKSFLFGLAFASALTFAQAEDVAPIEFLGKYCNACHGEEKQKGKRRFDELTLELSDFEAIEHWQEIVDQLNLYDMPPEDEPQPTDEERDAMIDAVTALIDEAQANMKSSGGHTTLRRLNAAEYRYTVQDLLGVNTSMWDPAADFPKDIKVHGFDNNGEALITSNILLEQYLNSAETIVEKATNFEDPTEMQLWASWHPFHYSKLPEDLADAPQNSVFKFDRYRPKYPGEYTKLVGRHDRGGSVGFRPWAKEGAPASGIYTVRAKIASAGVEHPYPRALERAGAKPGDLNILEVRAVDRRGSISDSRVVVREKLDDVGPQWMEWDVYMEKGYQPEIRMGNGPGAAKNLMRIVLNGEGRELEHMKPFVEKGGDGLERWHAFFNAYQGPQIRVYEFQVKGPHPEEWPPKGQTALYGDLEKTNKIKHDRVVERLHTFAAAAFRRPVHEGELDDIQAMVFELKKEDDITDLDALQLGFEAILASPGFLYLDHSEGELDSYALASRLSYFLFSSMPDAELAAAAASGEIDLLAQTERMLADPKSDRFVKEFIYDWLHLGNIGEMPPNNKAFREYYRDQLGAAMATETEMYFRDLLTSNGPVNKFLDSDYTFLNEPLAKHYGIEGVEGLEFQRVSLTDRRRGGLTGQGAFLTASANGVDTSPVVRGVYLLEQILGEVPAPPPPDVPGLEPDIRGATTIREMLVKHREIKTCAECHRSIDPPGFALENFNAIGGWRDKYGEGGKGLDIDASGALKGDLQFDGVVEFKKHLLTKEDQFTRCLTEKLLTYALGRELDIQDRPEIDRILEELDTKGNGLKDLLMLVVSSELFTNN
ncbi:MAG: DUF1592 domain-containing protein [Verrucomicrobiota bacterium]